MTMNRGKFQCENCLLSGDASCGGSESVCVCVLCLCCFTTVCCCSSSIIIMGVRLMYLRLCLNVCITSNQLPSSTSSLPNISKFACKCELLCFALFSFLFFSKKKEKIKKKKYLLCAALYSHNRHSIAPKHAAFTSHSP